MDFTGKKALVTGSGGGIGKSIALLLADMGADIVVNDVSIDNAQQTAKEVISKGRKAIVSNANVVNDTQVREMFESIASEFGRIDILVNNAGITKDSLLMDMEEEQWDQVMDVNLKGVFLCCRYAAKMMSEQQYGKIINISSASGQIGNIGQVNYAASKGGVISITKTLAKELARYQINVNAVAPGFIKTPMTQTVPEKVEKYLIGQIPLRRAGEPEEIANAIAFLASDMSEYITGQVLSVNGGMYV
ncbi:MAG: 3-oxoacyl-[acyl-carrier-protein] reductase [Desulfobacula sp.]|jgi:3-oxoacyl-(acyl-carrier-protein) reductase|uniref:3-oxoacyl-[acyl-carrier-protein] reductase n=1 Tax=Desulfobacula sp. TaxID=2593537 RepID=UPI001D5859BF|nr:3-oxoacyl-[acyl-carrier-protein] reductase [Desulfobacula sp.]MBT4024371.1 3-oxoacyl-[acyl-carrier-protein] reductase [Desulfobacula sp.]MBT4199682.1 3-oxoacyl-[acyl-carrier-protein] reductase [Desulfobacula sp.]MBT4875599.1 3-oxoacyl-[acyl-carrier-protein] reductase [Desulfobacula sp.]MBT5547042.1 3-oxoacyl-[acyl-carrier-protein] reductase [Desulfobacula sp.]